MIWVSHLLFQLVIYKVNEVKFKFMFFETKEREYLDCKLINKQALTHDTYMFEFQLPSKCWLRLRTCEHVEMKTTHSSNHKNKCSLMRYYTPIPERFDDLDLTELSSDRIRLAIKLYEIGSMSKHLKELSIETGIIQLSAPIAITVDVDDILSTRSNFYLVAAGTGITPILNVIHCLNRTANQSKRSVTAKLAYFNKSERDIIFGDRLKSFESQSSFRFELLNVLSNPTESWNGTTGKVTKSLLQPWFDDIESRLNESFIFICGPNGFVVCTVK